jgi:hypothetical protein
VSLALALTFTLAAGTVSADCRAFERHVSGIGKATVTSEIVTAYCEVWNDSEIWTARPIVGQAIIFSVRGVDPNGLKSPWTGD